MQPGAFILHIRNARQLGIHIGKMPFQILEPLLGAGDVGIQIGYALKAFREVGDVPLQIFDLLITVGQIAPLLGQALFQLGHFPARFTAFLIQPFQMVSQLRQFARLRSISTERHRGNSLGI